MPVDDRPHTRKRPLVTDVACDFGALVPGRMDDGAAEMPHAHARASSFGSGRRGREADRTTISRVRVVQAGLRPATVSRS